MSEAEESYPTDDQLIERAAAGDMPAFACLVRRHQAHVVGFAARMLGGDVDAGADVAQETFLKLWENRDRYVRHGKMVSYLLRIAHNLCVSRLRSPGEKFLPLETAETLPAHDAPLELPLMVRRALLALPVEQRVVFLLHEYEGLSYTEIADCLYVAPGTVASRKHAAVMALRKSLAAYLGDGK